MASSLIRRRLRAWGSGGLEEPVTFLCLGSLICQTGSMIVSTLQSSVWGLYEITGAGKKSASMLDARDRNNACQVFSVHPELTSSRPFSEPAGFTPVSPFGR